MNMLINSDCLSGLKTLPDGCVNTCVTSPPYFGLRDYGVDGQIGLEPTPQDFVDALVSVFREVKRVLRDDGTLWLNLGDSYARTGGTDKKVSNSAVVGSTRNSIEQRGDRTQKTPTGLKEKDLIGIPWRVAFALQADGWYLRQDIIWHKPNPMPESVTDRCTKSHEHIFLLSKSPKYYFDHEAIKEDSVTPITTKSKQAFKTPGGKAAVNYGTNEDKWEPTGKRNKRDVWTVTTKPYKEAHFATFPPDLIRPCVLAGAPAGGVVLDPFMGAGTTAMVAKIEGRQYVGFELNPEYIKIAEKRLNDVVSQQLLWEPRPAGEGGKV